jgi:hypothetical protein
LTKDFDAMRKLFLAFCAAAILGATPAFAADSASCIRRNDVHEWASPAAGALVVENSARHRILLTLTSGCSGFGVYDQLAIGGVAESRASCIAAGDTVTTVYAGERGVCRVVSVAPFNGPLPPRVSHL